MAELADGYRGVPGQMLADAPESQGRSRLRLDAHDGVSEPGAVDGRYQVPTERRPRRERVYACNEHTEGLETLRPVNRHREPPR